MKKSKRSKKQQKGKKIKSRKKKTHPKSPRKPRLNLGDRRIAGRCNNVKELFRELNP
jgi:hypothetical protein